MKLHIIDPEPCMKTLGLSRALGMPGWVSYCLYRAQRWTGDVGQWYETYVPAGLKGFDHLMNTVIPGGAIETLPLDIWRKSWDAFVVGVNKLDILKTNEASRNKVLKITLWGRLEVREWVRWGSEEWEPVYPWMTSDRMGVRPDHKGDPKKWLAVRRQPTCKHFAFMALI